MKYYFSGCFTGFQLSRNTITATWKSLHRSQCCTHRKSQPTSVRFRLFWEPTQGRVHLGCMTGAVMPGLCSAGVSMMGLFLPSEISGDLTPNKVSFVGNKHRRGLFSMSSPTRGLNEWMSEWINNSHICLQPVPLGRTLFYLHRHLHDGSHVLLFALLCYGPGIIERSVEVISQSPIGFGHRICSSKSPLAR